MDIDKQLEKEKCAGKISMVLVFVFGVIGIFAPFLSIFIATFKGVSDISIFNSTMMLVLSLLVIVFQVVHSFSAFNNNQKRAFVVGVIILFICIISFMLNLAIFVNL